MSLLILLGAILHEERSIETIYSQRNFTESIYDFVSQCCGRIELPLERYYEIGIASYRRVTYTDVWRSHFSLFLKCRNKSRQSFPGIILCVRPANERRRYIVTPSLIGWAHTQNDPCILNNGRWPGSSSVGQQTPTSVSIKWLLQQNREHKKVLKTKYFLHQLPVVFHQRQYKGTYG